MSVTTDVKNYDRVMASGWIENLLEQANSCATGDTSIKEG